MGFQLVVLSRCYCSWRVCCLKQEFSPSWDERDKLPCKLRLFFLEGGGKEGEASRMNSYGLNTVMLCWLLITVSEVFMPASQKSAWDFRVCVAVMAGCFCKGGLLWTPSWPLGEQLGHWSERWWSTGGSWVVSWAQNWVVSVGGGNRAVHWSRKLLIAQLYCATLGVGSDASEVLFMLA